MLGLRNSLITSRNPGITIVTDNLVLRHDYRLHPVQPLSDGAAYFVESNTDYISVSDAASLSFDACSFSAWIFVTDATDFPIIGKGVYNSTAEYQLKVQSDDKIHFWVADESVASCHIGRSTPTITSYENQWIHVAGTYDGGTASSGLKIYINGVQVDSTNDEANTGSFVAMENLGADVEIGKYSSTYGDGYICNVGIWDAVLTQAQIKSIMWKDYAGLSDSEKTDLVSWWNLDSTVEDLGTAVYDNYHGDGNTLGSELIDNGGFDDGLDGLDDWTNGAGTFNVVDGECVFTDENGQIFQSIVVTAGNTYQVSFDYDVSTGDSVRINADGTLRLVATSGSGSYVATFVAATSSVTHHIRVYGYMGAGEECTIDNVSVKEINGNTGTLS